MALKRPIFKPIKYSRDDSRRFAASCDEPQSTGLTDRNGRDILNGTQVQLYLKGEWHICKVVWYRPLAMFCLLWEDGYVNKFQLHVDNYQVVDGLTDLEIINQRIKRGG